MRLLSYKGDRDGIRYGQISFGGHVVRSYFYDRLNGVVRLFFGNGVWAFSRADKDPERIALAHMILRGREPGEDAILEHCIDEDRPVDGSVHDLSTSYSKSGGLLRAGPLVTVRTGRELSDNR